MADIYDVNRAIESPNFLQTGQQAYAFGQQQRQARQAQADDAALRGLAPSILTGDQAAIAQGNAISPERTAQYDEAGNAQLRKLKGFIDYVDQARAQAAKTGDIRAVNAALQQGGSFLSAFTGGKPPPSEWTPDMEPGWEALKAKVSTLGKAGGGEKVFAQKVGADGNIYNTYADGTIENTGIKADRQMWLRDQPGLTPGLVGKDASFTPLGSAPAPAGFTAGQGESQTNVAIDDISPEKQQQIANVASTMRAAGIPEDRIAQFVSETLSAPQTVNSQGNQLQNTQTVVPGVQMRPAIAPADQARIDLATQAGQRADEASQRAADVAARGAAPTGYRFKPDGSLELIPGAPGPAAASKSKSASAAKVPQLNAVERGVERIDNALATLNKGALADTGRLDQYVQQFTPAGQELETAVGAIQNAMLALTRVPGIGSQSDFEAKIANLQYPSLAAPPETNRRTIENLKLFIKDLRKQVEGAAGQSDNPTYTVGQQVEHNGKMYRVVGGDPTDPDLEEVQ